MTTLFGLTAKDTKIAILAADRQGTSHLKGSNPEKYMGRKIWKANGGMYAFGMAGRYDPKTTETLKENIVRGKIDIEKVTREGFFPEFRELNLEYLGNGEIDPEKSSSIVLASRFNQQPKLYHCLPLGEVRAVETPSYVFLGTGSKRVSEYLQALQTLGEAKDYMGGDDSFTRKDAIQISLEAVRHAQERDIFSSGLDMIVLTPRTTRDHFADLQDDFGKRLKKIQQRYRTITQKK